VKQSRQKYRTLVTLARAARRRSVSPYSRFRVGAALLGRSGTAYTGCNVETSSYSLTICAERTALFKALSEGEKHFQAIAIAADTDGFVPPCGACRQVLFELAGDIDVILVTGRGRTRMITLSELLPHPFTARNLQKHRP